MFLSLAFASLLLASVTGQCPPVPDGGCSVCGEGLCVGNPETVFAFPGFPAVPCGSLQEAGYTGAVPISQCPFLPNLIGDCGCGTGSAIVAPPTPAPVAPTPSPVAPTGGASCPEVPAGGCSVCGDGECVQNPEAIFVFPGFPSVPCGLLEQAGFGGSVPLDQCGFLASLIGACECGVPAVTPPTPAPVVPPTSVPVPPPTSVPVPPPTSVPVPPPTTAPVPRPTSVPVPPPTSVPVPPPTSVPVPPPTTAPVPRPTTAPVPAVTPSPVTVPTSSGKKSGGMSMTSSGKRRALSDHALRHGRAL
jgi:hypothetical protein